MKACGLGEEEALKVQAIYPIFLTKPVHNNKLTAVRQPRKQKPKRNTEQRTPGRKTLKDFFPIINQSTVTKQQHRVITLESDTHVLQRTTRQKSYKVTSKQYSKEQVTSNESRRIITPGERTPRVRKSHQKRGKQSSTKICRSLQKEFHKAETKKSGRQSKLYTNEEWVQAAKDNTPVESFFGHSMVQIDNTTVYRILLQNPNGINPNPDNYNFQLSLNVCYDQCISFIGLTETNINWLQHQNREHLRTSLRKWWDGTTFQTSTSTIPFKEKYKPGGTVSIVCGNHWVARVIEKGDDASGLGRWTYVGLQGDQNTKVLHITWYLLCKQSESTVGEKTTFMQQYTLLREKFPEMTIHPRRQSVLDMQLFITQKQREGYLIILLTDGNENLSAEKKGFCPHWERNTIN